MAAWTGMRLLQQGQHIVHLSLVRQRRQGRTQVRRHGAERGHRPGDLMFVLEQLPHRLLRIESRPLADAAGHGRRGFAGDDSQALFQRKNAGQADAGVAGLIANAPQRDDAEQRGDAATPRRRRTTPIDILIEVDPFRRLTKIGLFQVVDNPLEDGPAHLLENLLQIMLERLGGGGRDGAMAKAHDPFAKPCDQRKQLDGHFQKRGGKRASQEQWQNGRKRHQASFPDLAV
jgi:hypothetical protein